MGFKKRIGGVLAAAGGGLVLAAGAQVARGQCQANELTKLLADDGAAGDMFGLSVAVTGNTAVVGAFQDSDQGASSGSAYVFRDSGLSWVQDAKLLASDSAAGDFFGRAVGISGDTAVVGAHLDNHAATSSGSAYAFWYDDIGSSWSEEDKLVPSDAAVDQRFGCAVAVVDGPARRAVFGAWQDAENGSNAGSAYVFRYDDIGSSWIEEAKLLSSDGAEGDHFGYSVAISGDAVVVGAHQDDDNGSSSGSAYVFRYNGLDWGTQEETKLLASDGGGWDHFGYSVAISGDAALVGAFQDSDLGSCSGSAYVFRYDGLDWGAQEEAKLLPLDGAASDNFGRSVSISGNTAVIGALYDDDIASESGSAYAFWYNGTSWAQQAKLLPSDGAQEDFFGVSVGISGDTTVIGAHGDDDNGDGSGSAYVFRGLADCNQNDVLDICDIAGATSSDCNSNGIPDECEPGDTDGDGDVDLSDFATFALCYAGAGITVPPPSCSAAWFCSSDIDGDNDVDLSDFATFALNYGG